MSQLDTNVCPWSSAKPALTAASVKRFAMSEATRCAREPQIVPVITDLRISPWNTAVRPMTIKGMDGMSANGTIRLPGSMIAVKMRIGIKMIPAVMLEVSPK